MVTGPGLEPGTTGLKERTLGVGKRFDCNGLADAESGGRSEWRSNPPENAPGSMPEAPGADAAPDAPATPPNATAEALAVLLAALPPEAKAALRDLLNGGG